MRCFNALPFLWGKRIGCLGIRRRRAITEPGRIANRRAETARRAPPRRLNAGFEGFSLNLDYPGKGMPTDAGVNASSRLSCCDWRATRRMGPAFRLGSRLCANSPEAASRSEAAGSRDACGLLAHRRERHADPLKTPCRSQTAQWPRCGLCGGTCSSPPRRRSGSPNLRELGRRAPRWRACMTRRRCAWARARGRCF